MRLNAKKSLYESFQENLKELDTWVDSRSEKSGWKVKVLDVIPDEYGGSTVAKVELFDKDGNSQGEDTIYIHRQKVKIGETYDAYIDGIMAMPKIKGVPNFTLEEVPDMKKVTKAMYESDDLTEGDNPFYSFQDSGQDDGLLGRLWFNIDNSDKYYTADLMKIDGEYRLVTSNILLDTDEALRNFIDTYGYDNLLDKAISYYKSEKGLKESVQGLAQVIWGNGIIADKEHMGEDYELFSIICDNIDEAEDEYNDGKISKKEFLNKIKIQCNEGQLNDEETKAVIDFYEKSYSDSPDDMSDEESFTMYNDDYDKEVKVWKQDGKWYDDEGNRYMGYLSKQDVKNYFKGNWRELKESSLKEATDNKDWEEICKAFCKKIGAELVFVNDDNFGYIDKDGSMVHMYADELEKYLKGQLNEAYGERMDSIYVAPSEYAMVKPEDSSHNVLELYYQDSKYFDCLIPKKWDRDKARALAVKISKNEGPVNVDALIKEVENGSKKVNEAIEQKYEKSNDNYNSFLRDVKKYTGSYDYLYGGNIDSEYAGNPIKVQYFYYDRPYAGGGYNLVVNVLTPMGMSGGWIQDEIEKGFERNSKTKLSNKEIKDKINQIVSQLK